MTAAEADDIRMLNTTKKDLKGADLMVYLAHDKLLTNTKGPAGVASLGTVCDTRPQTWTRMKHSITQYQEFGITVFAWVKFLSKIVLCYGM